MRIPALVALTFALAACGDDDRPSADADVATDATLDIGTDTGEADTGEADTGEADTGEADTGEADALVVDGLSIVVDYRFDRSGFFTDPARRAALEAAAAVWSSALTDDFEDIPAGTSIRTRDPEDPSGSAGRPGLRVAVSAW